MNRYIFASLCFLVFAVLFVSVRAFFNVRNGRKVREDLRNIYGGECCRLLSDKEDREMEQSKQESTNPDEPDEEEATTSRDDNSREASVLPAGKQWGDDDEQV